jgi:aspartate 4-decarboxylase
VQKHIHPLDLAFRLAEAYGLVFLSGGGFEAPNWSLRLSLANLPDVACEQIRRGVRLIVHGCRDMHQASSVVPAK